MRTVEIPKKDWQRAPDEFSAVHDGWLISLDVLGLTIGAQPEIRNLPLRGVTAEGDVPDPTIMISAARDDGEALPENVDGMPAR